MKQLTQILWELHPEVDFDTADGLIDMGILDSFDIITLVAEIDDHWGVVIPPEELRPENFNSAGAMYALIQSLREA